MKKKLFFLFLFVLSIPCFSNDFDEYIGRIYKGFCEYSYDSIFFINESSVYYDYPEEWYNEDEKYLESKRYECKIEGKNGNYKVFLFDDEKKEEKKLYMLISRYYIVLYNETSPEPIFIGNTLYRSDRFRYVNVVTATSCLVEKSTKYEANNLSNLRLDSPWSEGINGYGIDEKITCKTTTPVLVFFSGFFSIKNQSLYENNSRPKVIEIYSEVTKLSKLYYLNDTPAPQILNIIDILQCDYREDSENTITITIKDVYKGKKYADTCINSIFEGCIFTGYKDFITFE